jgi:hypothetical protein
VQAPKLLGIQRPDARVGGPLSEIIPFGEVEQEAEGTPQDRKTHVGHDCREIPC